MSVQYEALKKFCHIGAHAQCVHVIVCMHTVAVQRPTVVYILYSMCGTRVQYLCVLQKLSKAIHCNRMLSKNMDKP